MAEDKREFVRVNRILDLEYSVDATTFTGRITDLGEGGAFLDATYPQPAGTVLQFRLELPDDPQPIEGRARVAWHEPMLGMGIAFVDLTEPQRDQLRFFVGSTFFGGGGEAGE
jgi:uncharacterized protein (TIGR02266 family)